MMSGTRARNTWAIVVQALATYHPPMFEALADALPEEWTLAWIRPKSAKSEHPAHLVTPAHPRLRIIEVEGGRIPVLWSRGKMVSNLYRGKTYLPSAELWAALRRERPAGLIIHEFSPFSLMALIYGKLHRRPVASWSEVGAGNIEDFSAKVARWHRLWSRFVDGRIAACPAARGLVNGREVPQIDYFHAVDSRKFQLRDRDPDSGRPVIFAFSGQLLFRKGIDLLMRAAGTLRKRGAQNFRLRMIGEGDLDWAKAEAEAAGVADLVEWTGYLSGQALRTALAEADVFILPSRKDTYAVVVHEAACLGLPLIISQHAGAADAVVEEGVNGFRINPEDLSQFAQKMQVLLDPDLRSRFSRAARRRAEELSPCARAPRLAAWLQKRLQTDIGSM